MHQRNGMFNDWYQLDSLQWFQEARACGTCPVEGRGRVVARHGVLILIPTHTTDDEDLQRTINITWRRVVVRSVL